MQQADQTHKAALSNIIRDTINQHKRFAIFSHEEPDGDAIGSQIAITTALRKLGKEVLSLRVDPSPPALEFLNCDQAIRKYDPVRDNNYIREAEVTIIVDCCDYFRLGDLAEIVEDSPSLKINIDHHRDNVFFGDLNYVRFIAGGAAELAFEVIKALEIPVTGIIAQAIYVGMSTDTVGFRYIDPEGSMLRVIDKLITGGIDVEDLQERIYCNQPDDYLENLAALLQTVTYEENGSLAWFTMFKSDYLSFYQRELASEAPEVIAERQTGSGGADAPPGAGRNRGMASLKKGCQCRTGGIQNRGRRTPYRLRGPDPGQDPGGRDFRYIGECQDGNAGWAVGSRQWAVGPHSLFPILYSLNSRPKGANLL